LGDGGRQDALDKTNHYQNLVKGSIMNSQDLISPESQGVTFVELFFDLVFVFSVTQVVGLLHHDFSLLVVGQAILVFWLVWWAWTQFTWTLNAANTDHSFVQIATLLATAVAFFMAVALPDAFGERALWFAITYVIVRGIGLVLNYWVASGDASGRSAVRAFLIMSCGGFILVLPGGILGSLWQLWFWAGAILLDLVAVQVAGNFEGWNIHPEHFAERHGLFVIIALGETLIVAAGRVTGSLWTESLLAIAILAVTITCALWWTHFPRAKPVLDHALETSQGPEKTHIARDVYSLLHFVMLLGVIAYAFAVEESVAHPGEPLAIESRLSLAIGLLLFVGGMAMAIWRATKKVLVPRLILILATSLTILMVSGVPAVISMGIAFTGILLIAIIEQGALKLNKVEALES
jgi:low temperature requirement protein LtrA